MSPFRSKLVRLFAGPLTHRYAQLALLLVPCLFALLLGVPMRDGRPTPEAAPTGEVSEPQREDQRAPSFAPVGLVWGICCASVFGAATLAGPLKRAVARRLRHGAKRSAHR